MYKNIAKELCAENKLTTTQCTEWGYWAENKKPKG